MAKKTVNKYCYKTPSFPIKAYAVVLFISTQDSDLAILPFSFIYTDLASISESVDESIKDIRESSRQQFEIADMVGIFPITLQKKFPLKKEYWTKSKGTSTFEDKLKIFVKVIDKPFLYKLLVTPYSFNKKENRWLLSSTYPFSVFADDKEVEEFMYLSNQVVDSTANSAAFYIIENPKRFNWKTGEIFEIERDIPKLKPLES